MSKAEQFVDHTLELLFFLALGLAAHELLHAVADHVRAETYEVAYERGVADGKASKIDIPAFVPKHQPRQTFGGRHGGRPR